MATPEEMAMGFPSNPFIGTPFGQAQPTNTPTKNPPVATWIVNLLKNEPQLKAIYDAVRNPTTGEFIYNADAIADMITSSDWYLSKGPTVAANLVGRQKYGEKWYQDKVNQYKVTVSGIANGMGINASDPTVADYLIGLAETSFLNGWDADYIQNTIIGNASIVSKASGGIFQSKVDDIRSYGKLMGVDISQTTANNYLNRLIGTTTPQGLQVKTTAEAIKKEIADRQALLYPFFSDDFAAGRTLWDVTSLQRKKWADLLEVDEDTLDWNDPLWKDGKIFTVVDEKTGKVVQRPAWDAEKIIKADERWQYTENATRAYEGLGANVLRRLQYIE